MTKNSSIFLLIFYLPFCGLAQQQQFSHEQIFGTAPNPLVQPLPNILQWIDDDHYLERKMVDEKDAYFSVEALTGKSTAYAYAPEEKIAVPAGVENGFYSPDKKSLAFTKGNNLFIKNKPGGQETQLTFDGNADIANGYTAYVYYEEILGRSHRSFWWSPDSKHLVFLRYDETSVPVFPVYHAEGKYGWLQKQHYPQPGDKIPMVKMGIVDVNKPGIVWADFDEHSEQYLFQPIWLPDNTGFWAQQMSRNQKDLSMYTVDFNTGSKKQVYEEHQSTWVDFKWGTWFLQKTKQHIIFSDKDGWNHLYLYNIDGSLVNQITSGAFSVTDLLYVDEDKKLIYFAARKENSARYDVYVTGFDGKNITRLSSGNYSHEQIRLSPHAKYFISTASNINMPPKILLYNRQGKMIQEIANSKAGNDKNYAVAKTELIRIKSDNGKYDLPVKITYPLNFDPQKKYPLLIEVYGGPGLGKVYDTWSNDLRSQWWAKEGIIQVWMDNRSSGHFGKAGMNEIYKQCGKLEIEDFIACTDWLKKQSYVDTSKICITGFSYGGFMTCLALTKGAGVFTHGRAYYPLTDWLLYDCVYAEKFMGTPAENPEGYRITSPQNYIDNYKGLLRISHGDADDNVHLQQTLQLINRLQDLHKHVELMIYPGEKHGRGLWSKDKRALSKYEDYRFIYEQLLNQPIPAGFTIDK